LPWLALFALLLFARTATADNLCAPAPVGVFGLTGAPDFANQPEVVATNNDLVVPAGFGQELDDPRWNGSWRLDFAGGGATEAGMRALQDGNILYLSYLVYADPTATLTGGADRVYVGFSDGTKADLAQIVINAGEPLRNSTSISGTTWFKTLNGGASWTLGAGPLIWVETGKIRAWSGAGTHAWGPANGPGTGVTGVRWAINMRIDLALVGSHLGLPGALPRPFKFFSEISIATPAGSVPYDWPLGTSLGLSTTPTIAVANWGNANSDLTTCSGTSVTWDHIGTTPITAGIPSTTVFYPPRTDPNQFVAVLTDTIPGAQTVQARFRIANWGSQIGVGGDWRDILPPNGSNPGTVLNGVAGHPNEQIVWPCVNPGGGAGDPCPTLTGGQAKDQCLLVELSQAPAAVGVTFKQDSARRNMDFVNASTFERSAEISIKGLAPLAGGGGQRDVYLYVKAANMPKDVTAAPPGGAAGGQAGQGRPGTMVAGQDGRSDKQPSLPPTTYERLSTSYPTYEVHVYHTTGKTRQEDGRTVNVLEPQVPFGYFVQHQGSLAGWEHSLAGEGVTLELVAPDFYHVKIADNGSINVHTKIVACQRYFFGLFRCCCNVGGAQGSGADGSLVALALGLLLVRLVRRRRSDRR
jgi:hypothetical protein